MLCPAVPFQLLISALARTVGEGSGCFCCAGSGPWLCIPVLCLPQQDVCRAAFFPGPLVRGRGAALLASAAMFGHGCVSGLHLLLLLSPLLREKQEGLSFAVSLGNSGFSSANAQAFSTQLALQPSSPNTNCSLNVSNNPL